MNQLQVFNYNQNHQIRTTVIDGEPWFVAKDLGDILGFANVRVEVSRLDDDERRVSQIVTPSNGGYSDVSVISESGLYALIFRSTKPEAKQFSRWVRKVVLPQIRKTGMFLSDSILEQVQNNPECFHSLLKQYVALTKKNDKLQKKLDEQMPLATLGKTVLALTGSITIGDAAHLLAQKGINIGQNRLYARCRDDGLLCKRKGKQWNQPTQKAIEKGLMNAQIEGGFRVVAMVTPQGLLHLSNVLTEEQLPLIALIEASNDE